MKLNKTLHGKSYCFHGIKDIMNKAGELRSGDVMAGLAAKDAQERMAARILLADMTVGEIRENPAVPYEQDSVTRVIQDSVHELAFSRICSWTVGELRNWLLSDKTTLEHIEFARKGLTSEMIAAVTKLMSNADLVTCARKMPVVVKSNTTLGLSGRLAARLQPNDTQDDPASILAQICDGLSFGSGDAVIGINPVTDTPEQTGLLLNTTWELIQALEIPTQNCVLSHITTQMEAIRRGAHAGMIFQSIGGSEKCLTEFGVDVPLLDEAWDLGRHCCPVAGPNVMYFETGQGSALSANAHFETDQLTMEARSYGLAKKYNPFLVNTVVGFIGLEYLYDQSQIIRAGLEDHFMGKLHGLPMGCDCCYTNHAATDQNGNENLMLLLAVAGVNYLITMAMGEDIMLNYQTCSFHDMAMLRQLLNLRPAPEFEVWLEKMGIMENGKLTSAAGDPALFFRKNALALK